MQSDIHETGTEAVERMAKVFDGDEPGRFGDRVGTTLRALARERDDYRAQLARATDPAYLTEALEKIGAVDPEDYVTAIARAEAAEAERDALMRVVRAAENDLCDCEECRHAFRRTREALAELTPGLLDQDGCDNERKYQRDMEPVNRARALLEGRTT